MARRVTIMRAWDRFWDYTQHLQLHHLGCQVTPTAAEKQWVELADEMQKAGPLTIRQIEAITDLIEQTVKLVKEKE